MFRRKSTQQFYVSRLTYHGSLERSENAAEHPWRRLDRQHADSGSGGWKPSEIPSQTQSVSAFLRAGTSKGALLLRQCSRRALRTRSSGGRGSESGPPAPARVALDTRPGRTACRMLKKAVQRGRSERRGESRTLCRTVSL